MSTIISPPRRTIAPALWDAPVLVHAPGSPLRHVASFAAALDLDAAPGAIVAGPAGVLAVCFADRPGVWQTTDAATVPA
jgi:hypothetical protein